MIRRESISVPGREIALTVPMAAKAVEVDPCEPDATGLFWYRDGEYSESLQTALLFEAGAINPKLTTARLLGETCDQDVEWSAIWENADGGDDGAPLVFPLGADLDVVAAANTVAGLLTVRATFGGTTYGPIDLLLLPGCESCYCYSDAYCPDGAVSNNIGGWLRLPDNFNYDSFSQPLEGYGDADGVIVIGVSTTTTVSFSIPDATELWIYCNDGGSGTYIVNADATPRAPQRGVFSPPWDGSGATVSIAGLSSLELTSDGYNAPWYVFVR